LQSRWSGFGSLAAWAGAVELKLVIKHREPGTRGDALLQFSNGGGVLHLTDAPAVSAHEKIKMLAGRQQYVVADPRVEAHVADGLFAAGAVDENAAHRLGGGAEEVGFVAPLLMLRAGEANPRLMNQCRGLQCLAGLLVRHANRRQLPQFLVNQRQQLMSGSGISFINGM